MFGVLEVAAPAARNDGFQVATTKHPGDLRKGERGIVLWGRCWQGSQQRVSTDGFTTAPATQSPARSKLMSLNSYVLKITFPKGYIGVT